MKCELKKKKTINALVVFDFEEVLSKGDAGAEGNFFENAEKFNAFKSKSLFVSPDSGHAIHSNC